MSSLDSSSQESGGCGETDAHRGIRGVTVPSAWRMNNATTLLLQRSVREHVADQMRCFFFYRDSLIWGRRETRDPRFGDAIRLAMNKDAMQVRIVPADNDLERGMEVGKAKAPRHEHTPPNRRADFQEENVKLIDFSQCLFLRQCLFSFARLD